MKIIYDTVLGSITEGVIAIDQSFRRKAIFVDNPENILGFRRYLKTYYSTALETEFIEVGYFFEMLYEGVIEAFMILKARKEFNEQRSLEWDLLLKEESYMVSRALVKNLLKVSEVLMQQMEKNKKSIKINEQKFEYDVNKAYICLRNLNLAIGVLQHSSFQLEKLDTLFLQGVLDNKFDLERIRITYDKALEKVEELLESSDLPEKPSIENFNSFINKIRNVEVINLDYEQ